MENKEIIEGNKLIEVFKGNEVSGDTVINKNGQRTHISESNFHKDWNMLMPVVEKIIKMPIENGCKKSILPINLYLESEFLFETKELTKTSDGYKYGFYYNSKFDKNYISGNLKHNAFLAVVEFIKWYNENKNNGK